MCQNSGIWVLDVFDDYADEIGVLRPEASDNVHIDALNNAQIRKKLNAILINARFG